MQELPPLPSFDSTPPEKPPRRFLVFPPNCVDVSNVVTQTRFSTSISGDQIMQTYPFCRRNNKNWRAVLLKTEDPDGAACIYDMGMMMITGCNSVRTSRYASDMYTDLIRRAGYTDVKIVDFRIINLTTMFGFDGVFDVDKYKREVDPTIRYMPDGFVGARSETERTGALLTRFARKGTALGTKDIDNLMFDLRDELDKMKSCLVPAGSEEETELEARIAKRRKREVQTTHAPPPTAESLPETISPR